MRVNDLGEVGLILRLNEAFAASYRPLHRKSPLSLIVGNGDDAAAWESGECITALTCDAATAGTHFDLSYMSPQDVGWRAMVSSQSDIAAMGMMPSYSTVTIGATGQETVATLEGIYRGMAEACSLYGGRVVGGDVVRADALFISVAMVGAAASGEGREAMRPMTRDAARSGDQIAVVGPLGGAAAGLRILTDCKIPGAEAGTSMIRAHLRPEPAVDAALGLVELGIRCAVDVSDGLAADVARICDASHTRAVIRLKQVPAEPGLRELFPDCWQQFALSGGEGYQLVFTGPKELVARAQAENPDIAVLGEMLEGPGGVEIECGDGTRLRVPGGFEHFGRGRNAGQ